MVVSVRLKWLLLLAACLFVTRACISTDQYPDDGCKGFRGCRSELWVYNLKNDSKTSIFENGLCYYGFTDGAMSVISEDSVLFNHNMIYDLNTTEDSKLSHGGTLSLDRHKLTYIENESRDTVIYGDHSINPTIRTRIGILDIHDQSATIVLRDSLTLTDSTYTISTFKDPVLLFNHKLLFGEFRYTYTKDKGDFVDKDFGLYLMDFESNSIKRISNKNSLFYDVVTVSKDGRLILYQQPENGHDAYYIYDMTSHSNHRLKNLYFYAMFTPDDKNILWGKDGKLWIVPIDETSKKQLSQDGEIVDTFTISDDGQFIAYSCQTDSVTKAVFLLNLENQHKLFIASEQDLIVSDDEFNSIGFLPSGDKIAYTFKRAVSIPCD